MHAANSQGQAVYSTLTFVICPSAGREEVRYQIRKITQDKGKLILLPALTPAKSATFGPPGCPNSMGESSWPSDARMMTGG